MGIVDEANYGFIRTAECIYKHKSQLIFYTIQNEKIYVWDDDTDQRIEIADLSSESSFGWLFVTCIAIKDILYFIPFVAQDMMRYHIETGEFERVSIRSKSDNAMYHKVSYYDEKIYLFPNMGTEIFIYNIVSGKKKKRRVLVTNEYESDLFFSNIYMNKHRVWSVTGKNSNIYCYDMEQDLFSVSVIKGCGNAIMDITGENDELFLLTSEGEIFAWNINDKTDRLIMEHDGKNQEVYFAIRYSFGRLWLIPKSDPCIRAVDIYGGLIYEWNFSHLNRRKMNGFLFESVVQQDEFLLLSSFGKGGLVIIDTKECSVEVKDIHFNLVQKLEMLMSYSDEVLLDQRQMIGTYIWNQMKKS